MVKYTEEKVIRQVPDSYVCDCCGEEWNVDYNYVPTDLDAGFSVITGNDPSHTRDYPYRLHACSMKCTLALVRKHYMPTVQFPVFWTGESFQFVSRVKWGD